jgi:hypothetical protein
MAIRYMLTQYCYVRLHFCPFLCGKNGLIYLFQKIGDTVLKDDYEPSTYASVTGIIMCSIFLPT